MGMTFVTSGDAINITIDGEIKTLRKSHENYTVIVNLLKKGGEIDEKELLNLIDPAENLKTFSQGLLKVENGEVFYKHKVEDTEIKIMVDRSLISRIETMADDGFSVNPLVNFYENLIKNPSNRSVIGFYKFLERNKLPLTEDGCFFAYKKVRQNYTDIHSGTVSNKVGETVEMMRNQVNDDFRDTCSYGLHFASFEYARDFYVSHDSDDRMLVLKINPADVVAFPNDCDGAKGRCCRYEVFKEIPNDKVEYLLEGFQGIDTVDKFRGIIAKVREIITRNLPDGYKGEFKLDTNISEELHKTKVLSIIKTVKEEYSIDKEVEFTKTVNINNLVKFISKEVDLSEL